MKSFRRSLRTKDQSEALSRAAIAEREYDSLLASAAAAAGISILDASPRPSLGQVVRPVSQGDLDLIESDTRRTASRSWHQDYLMAQSDPARAELLREQWDHWQQNAETRREALLTPGFDDDERPWLPSPTRDARAVISAFGLDAPQGSPVFGAIVNAIRRGYVGAEHDVAELMAGRGLVRARQPSPVSIAPTFTATVAGYLEHRRPSEKTKREIERYVAEFVNLAGDKRLDAYTRNDFERFVKFRASRTVGGKTDGSIVRPAAAQTVAKALTFLRAPIDHAINHSDYAFAGPNPAVGIKVETYIKPVDQAVMPEKRPFKVGEINRILRHPWFTGCASMINTHERGAERLNGAEYWVPIIALLTGCRLAELAGLSVSEVMLDDPHPHIVVRANDARRVKTRSASRCVPIIDALSEHGFDDFVRAARRAGHDRLFPDWNAASDGTGEQRWNNSKLIRAFNRTVIPNQLGDVLPTSARREVTFHSFRGAFKTMLGSSEYRLHPNIINEVVGHAKSTLDQRYVGTIGIDETYNAVRACRFKGLILPTPPVV
nr:tyrosine-type recombinase/integrase [Sphingomonas jeddahensis]